MKRRGQRVKKGDLMDEKMTKSLDIQISMLKVSDFNVRQDLVEDEKFEANIKSLGVLQPLVVRPAGDEYEVVIGQNRFKAAKKAGASKIRCEIREMGDADVMVASLSENVLRKNLSPMDKAIATACLIGRCDLLEANSVKRDFRLEAPYSSAGALSKKLGVSKTAVNQWLEPLRLQPATQELVERHVLPVNVARKARQVSETPEEEVELAKGIAEVNEGVAPAEKKVFPEPEAMSLLSKPHPKEKIIARLNAKRDPEPTEEPKEDFDEEPDDWHEIDHVDIDGHKVTDADLIKRLNLFNIHLADYAEEMLKCWLDARKFE
jgi:ParB/RepB/Spo0J family partition protein